MCCSTREELWYKARAGILKAASLSKILPANRGFYISITKDHRISDDRAFCRQVAELQPFCCSRFQLRDRSLGSVPYALGASALLLINPFLALASNASVLLDPRVCDSPLQESESVPARLAPKGIDVKETYQTFRTDPTNSFNVIAGALGTNRLRHLNVSLAWCSRVRCVSVNHSRIRGFQAPLRRSWFVPIINHRTRSSPSFISWACPVICRSAIESQILRVPKPS